jgi:hypothetical protein
VNVLLLILDGLSPRHVRPDVMPTLTVMGERGGWNREGGIGVMPASTYPNHATFVTGVPPAVHGLWSSKVPWSADQGAVDPDAAVPLVDAWEVGPQSTTLFEACRRSGRNTAAVFGDHHLVGAMGADVADMCWPQGGHFGPEVARDALEYADDAATAVQIADAIGRGPDLVVAQLNGPDTAAHLYGPDSDEAFGAYRHTDEAIAVIHRALAAHWEQWVVVVVSDHSQEDGRGESIDLDQAAGRAGVEIRVIRDGSAAIIAGEGGRHPGWLDDVEGIAGREPLGEDAVVVWGRPGSSFGEFPWGIPGIHGSPRTSPQVAVVSGGHPAVGPLASWVEGAPPAGTAWAGTVVRLLELPTDCGIPAV